MSIAPHTLRLFVVLLHTSNSADLTSTNCTGCTQLVCGLLITSHILKAVGCCCTTGSKSAGALGDLAGHLGISSQNNLMDWADKALGQGLAGVTKSVKNLLSGARQAPVAAALEGLMDGKQVRQHGMDMPHQNVFVCLQTGWRLAWYLVRSQMLGCHATAAMVLLLLEQGGCSLIAVPCKCMLYSRRGVFASCSSCAAIKATSSGCWARKNDIVSIVITCSPWCDQGCTLSAAVHSHHTSIP